MIDDNDQLRVRIENLEKAFLGLYALTRDTLPPAYAEDADRMLSLFHHAAASFGGCDDTFFYDAEGNPEL